MALVFLADIGITAIGDAGLGPGCAGVIYEHPDAPHLCILLRKKA